MHNDKRQYQKRITLHLHEQTCLLIFLMFVPSHLWTTGDIISSGSLRTEIFWGFAYVQICIRSCFVLPKNAIKATMIMRSLKIPSHRQEVRALNPHWRKEKKKTSRKILVSDSRRRKRYREKVQWCPLLVKMMCNHSLTILHRVLLSAPLNVHLKSNMSHRIFQIFFQCLMLPLGHVDTK